MFKDFKKYGKWFDYINIFNFENKISIVITLLLMFFLRYLEFYENFNLYLDASINVLSCSIAGMFGLLGFSLSGIAFIVSIFPGNHRVHFQNKDTLDKVMSSFLFLAFNIGICVVLYTVVYFLIASNVAQVGVPIFWIITAIYIYSLNFIIFYTIALIRNCVWLNEIINKVSDADTEKEKFNERINEIRIDAILKVLNDNEFIDLDSFVSITEKLVNQSSIEDKKRAIEYLKKRYGYK